MTPGNIARPPRPITCCCRGFVAIISPNRTDWRIRMQRMSSTCCCIQIIVYVAKCLKKKYLRKLIRKPFESNIETYKQFCIIWCMNICTPVSMLHVYQRNFNRKQMLASQHYKTQVSKIILIYISVLLTEPRVPPTLELMGRQREWFKLQCIS